MSAQYENNLDPKMTPTRKNKDEQGLSAAVVVDSTGRIPPPDPPILVSCLACRPSCCVGYESGAQRDEISILPQ